MFLDWYIRFRHIDEWPETTGKVLDTIFVEGSGSAEGKYPDSRKVYFEYSAADGVKYEGMASGNEGSEIFYLDTGDAIKLRYDPRRAHKYFVAGAYHDSEVWTFFGFAALVVLVISLIGFFVRK
jgi:hypothetical protein